MPVLFAPEVECVRPIIDRAKSAGTMTYDELNKIISAEEVSSEDIEDTVAALQAMGIEVVEPEISEEQQAASDAAFLESIRARGARGLPMPLLNPYGWDRLIRAMDREKAARQQMLSEQERASLRQEAKETSAFLQKEFARLRPK